MLSIKKLNCEISGHKILNGLDLEIGPGEVHAIMGPNGSGKSTLASVISGNENYEVTSGSINFLKKNILELSPEERSHLGIFMSFQYPVEIPGVTVSNFIKAAMAEHKKAHGAKPLSAGELLSLMKENLALLNMDSAFLSRAMNDGFSGGEKKRNEIFQLAMLQPKLCILDETDSGLDIDALRTVASGINSLRDNHRSFLLITHYQRLLDYIRPDKVHVLSGGKIVKSGDASLALKLEESGYDGI